MEDILKQLRVNLLMSQEAQRNVTNLPQTLALLYQIENQVWLNTCNIKTKKPSKQLDNK